MMPTCRDVSALVAGDQLERASAWTRFRVRLHLAMCRYCRRYLREIRALGDAVRRLTREADDGVEGVVERVISAIGDRDGSTPLS